MTRIEIINTPKAEFSKSYVVHITHYKEGKIVETSDKRFPNKYLSFDRPVIETALELLERQYDI